VALLCAGSTTVQAKGELQEIKVKVEASEWDKNLLLEKLNANGKDQGLQFDESEQDYEYRIVFGTAQKAVGDQGINASMGSTTVFDAQGKEMFDFNRQARWTDSGAANAVAKEIVKRLVKMRSQTPK
jgi:hypothetical protein